MVENEYTVTAGPLGVLVDAIDVPDEISEASRNLFYAAGNVYSQEMGFNVDLYTVIGTTGLHIDAYFGEGLEGFSAMGLVLVNDVGACLTDGASVLPLPVGAVFRHDPCSRHGTCLPDGTQHDSGKFAFLSVDFDLSRDPEDDPRTFAAWALNDAAEKLAEAGLLSVVKAGTPA